MFFRFQQQPTSQPTPPSHSQYNANAMVQNQRDWAAGIPQTPEIQTQRTSYGYRHSQPIHQGASPRRSPRVSADGGWSLESLRNGSGQQGAGAHNSVAHLIADWGWESDYIQQLHLKASKTFTSSNC